MLGNAPYRKLNRTFFPKLCPFLDLPPGASVGMVTAVFVWPSFLKGKSKWCCVQRTLLQSLVLEHELRTIHLQVLPEELHLLICYLLLYSPKSLTQEVAMTPQTCRTQLSRRLLKLEDWPTLCWNQVESRSPQPHALESNLAKTLEWMTLRKQIVNKQGKRSLNKTNKVYKWPI